ncbi:MAG: hypothetical protein D6798_18745, partial [Deltaproteobacteria bacterium]
MAPVEMSAARATQERRRTTMAPTMPQTAATQNAGMVRLSLLLLACGDTPQPRVDVDNDGHQAIADGDGDGACEDCDDGNAAVFPGAIELCDGIDDDCDGLRAAGEEDLDGDGVPACAGDCDDEDPARAPGSSRTSIDATLPGDGGGSALPHPPSGWPAHCAAPPGPPAPVRYSPGAMRGSMAPLSGGRSSGPPRRGTMAAPVSRGSLPSPLPLPPTAAPSPWPVPSAPAPAAASSP